MVWFVSWLPLFWKSILVCVALIFYDVAICDHPTICLFAVCQQGAGTKVGGWFVQTAPVCFCHNPAKRFAAAIPTCREPKQTERSATTPLKTLLNIEKSWNK